MRSDFITNRSFEIISEILFYSINFKDGIVGGTQQAPRGNRAAKGVYVLISIILFFSTYYRS